MMSKKYNKQYIAKQLFCTCAQIAQWEKNGLIPMAKYHTNKKSYYSFWQIRKIISLAKKSENFTNPEGAYSEGFLGAKLKLAGVTLAVAYMAINLAFLGPQSIFAFSNQTTTMYTTVTAGILDILSASSSNSFTGVSVSFSSQTATASDMGAFRLSDARGSGAGWAVNLSARDWKAGEDVMQLDYNGTGTNDNLGKMCLIVASGAINSIAGQSTASITKGGLDCFSASVSTIDIYTAASSFGKGDYWITDFSLGQYIPSNPTAQNLTTTVILTVS